MVPGRSSMASGRSTLVPRRSTMMPWLWSESLVFCFVFFHAPNLFVYLQEALKHIVFSLLTPCVTYFPSYLSLKISSLTSFVSKVIRLLGHVFIVKISLKFYKICFRSYSTTISIKNRPYQKNPRGGSRVGITAVKDSMVFLRFPMGYIQLKILLVLTIKTGGEVRPTTNYFVIF